MKKLTILITGGYGFFGRRLVERLAGNSQLTLIIAGRNLAAARALEASLAPTANAQLIPAALDCQQADFLAKLREYRPDAVIHTAGPFQGQSYAVAEACLAVGVDYIDLADGSEYVAGIKRYHQAALDQGIALISGASSVPALSSAVALDIAKDFQRLDWIEMGISPANQTERGLATAMAVLGYCGKHIPTSNDPRRHPPVYGWSGTIKHRYSAPVGVRSLSPCDVPDLTLLSERLPGAPSVRFVAGLELPLLHKGMNCMALLAKVGLIKDWGRYARPLNSVANSLKKLGTRAGAMHVEACGVDQFSHRTTRRWELIALNNEGPYVPTLAAAALVRQLLEDRLTFRGASPCIGLITLAEFNAAAAGLAITMTYLPPLRAID